MTVRDTDNGNAMTTADRTRQEQNVSNAYSHFDASFPAKMDTGFLKLASIQPLRHMNFIINDPYANRITNVTLSPEEAKKVRDALLLVYPVDPAPTPAELEPGEYKVRDRDDPTNSTFTGGRIRGDRRYVVEQERPERRVYRVAETVTREDADKIAKALNEAEGL